MTKELIKESLEINCGYCRKKIDRVWVCKMEIPDITKYVFICPDCQNCLGVSESKHPDFITYKQVFDTSQLDFK